MARSATALAMLGQLRGIATALAAARRVLFITGAGISADSGLPTYRGVGGLYSDGATPEGLPIEAILSGPMFARDPALTWRYIRQIETACRGAEPNAAHRFIADLERSHEVWVLTQNVDGLHRAAGSTKLLEMHGHIHDLHCTVCAWRETVADYSTLAQPPLCPGCGALVRPAVVLFDEMLPAAVLATAERELARGFDMLFSIGTTAAFPYIAGPVIKAAAAGVDTVEINPAPTPVSALVRWQLSMRAAEALTMLQRLLADIRTG